MPELPEVETVRRQLVPIISGATVQSVEVEDARALKRHNAQLEQKVDDFISRLSGAQLATPKRRGKFMWIPFQTQHETVLLAHLGMSGQILARTEDAPDDKHVRARIWVKSKDSSLFRLDFADQRRFGSLALDQLIETTSGQVPSQVSHIAKDPLELDFDAAEWVQKIKSKRVGIKKVLLDQTLMSGVGNIYADEALWYMRIHPETTPARISNKRLLQLVDVMRDVFERALEWGGTSFDSQYVNVNGEAGYFVQSLEAYGRTGLACSRCHTKIQKAPFMGRNSHFCPNCQRKR